MAAETPGINNGGEASLVGTVNLQDGKIVSQTGNTFNISFNISNREGLQTGVKYGVQLVSDDSRSIADEKVFDESVTLYENTVLKRDITYVAPTSFNGNYNLFIVSKNESGFPFGMLSLGKVKLTSSTKSLQIINSSCYLKVEGDKANTHYTLIQNVDIGKDEALRLTCNTMNGTSDTFSLAPKYETRYNSAYGKISPQMGGDIMPIEFKASKNESFSVVLPKGDIPQFYNLKVSLTNGSVSSNTVSINYIIRGISATIQKVSLDKDFYRAGDKGEVSVLWSASAGDFARSGVQDSFAPKVFISLGIVNEKGRECISPVKQELIRDPQDSQSHIPFDIKTTCENPHVSTTISDSEGNILDQKDFDFTSVNTDEGSKPLSSKAVTIIIVVLLAILGTGILMKKKKSSNITVQ